ncbi:hypothetical protein ACQV18_03790 [Facklamia sp. P9177]
MSESFTELQALDLHGLIDEFSKKDLKDPVRMERIAGEVKK